MEVEPITTRTRLPFRLLSPEALLASPVCSVPGSPVLSAPLLPLLVLPQPASRPTVMDAERSSATSFLNFIVQSFLSFFHIHTVLGFAWEKGLLHYRAHMIAKAHLSFYSQIALNLSPKIRIFVLISYHCNYYFILSPITFHS